jgi:hypothetical protein
MGAAKKNEFESGMRKNLKKRETPNKKESSAGNKRKIDNNRTECRLVLCLQ